MLRALTSIALFSMAAACANPSPRQPGVRNAHAMIYDESARHVVMFGGADEAAVRGDTWAWDADACQWKRLAADGPSPRTFPSFAYDAARAEGVLFGGNRILFGTGSEIDTVLGDTWTWRDGRWSRRSVPGPHARSEAAIAYDRARQRVVLFGGNYRGESGLVRLGDTWEWDGTSWTEVATSGPEPRGGAAMAFDEARGRVVLFGGSGRPAGTWAWDGRSWLRTGGTEAPSVFNAVMTSEPGGGGLVRFGGWTGSTRIAETWRLLAAGWSQVEVSGPAPRNHAALVLDRGRVRVLLFGGHDGENVFGDLWEWSGGAWTRMLDVAPRRRIDNGH